MYVDRNMRKIVLTGSFDNDNIYELSTTATNNNAKSRNKRKNCFYNRDNLKRSLKIMIKTLKK